MASGLKWAPKFTNLVRQFTKDQFPHNTSKIGSSFGKTHSGNNPGSSKYSPTTFLPWLTTFAILSTINLIQNGKEDKDSEGSKPKSSKMLNLHGFPTPFLVSYCEEISTPKPTVPTSSHTHGVETVRSLSKKVKDRCGDVAPDHIHKVDFGTLQIDGERVPLTGVLYCPFDFANRTNEEIIEKSTGNYMKWAHRVGLIQETSPESLKEKIKEKSFARFVQCTTVAFNIEKVNEILSKTMPPLGKISEILSTATAPLSTEKTSLVTEYLGGLFMHDDAAESMPYPLLKSFDELIRAALDYPTNTHISKEEAKDLLKKKLEIFLNKNQESLSKLGDKASLEIKLTSIVNSFFETAFNFKEKFEELTKGNPSLIGYNDFRREIIKYLDASEREATTRGTNIPPSESRFYSLRLHTCAVDTVYMAATLASELSIPRELRSDSTSTKDIEDLCSNIICETNALFSAQREAGTPNWLHNDLHIIKTERNCSYTEAVEKLFNKINQEMIDLRINLQELDGGEINTNPKEQAKLLYLALVLQWGIGSIPAQAVASHRYFYLDSKGQKAPYLTPSQLSEIGESPISGHPLNIWDCFKPKTSA